MQALILSLLLAQPAVPQIVEDRPEPPVFPKDGESTYQTALRAAIDGNKPLITYIGRHPFDVRIINGGKQSLISVTARNGLTGYPAKCIIVSVPGGDGEMHWKATLSPDATDAEILQAIGGQLSASPFRLMDFLKQRREERRTADVDLWSMGPWSPGIEFPQGMFRYKSAANTQAIYRSGSFDRSAWRIDKIPRDNLEMKWQVPGHLEGLTGWKSTLYGLVPDGGGERKELLPVTNRDGYTQYELGHKREFPIGTRFDDVLTNDDGDVFEHRIAEKTAAGWERFITYRDAGARPAGYTPPRSRDCKSCHAEAGTGGYGVGLVPGGDTVISFPFRELE